MKYLLIVFLSIFSFSNIYSKELPDSVSAEYFGCKFDEGKDLNDEGAILWNDRDLRIDWPKLNNIIISDKDAKGIGFRDLNL
jgi:dTDP-4-dehydrorhamnose 3,5-epimerase-like enzyme